MPTDGIASIGNDADTPLVIEFAASEDAVNEMVDSTGADGTRTTHHAPIATTATATAVEMTRRYPNH